MRLLNIEEIFEAAIQILLFFDKCITVNFTRNAICIRLPTTRKLAEHLKIPHYYMLPYFATLEKEKLITRVERVGISTTKQGSKKLIELMTAKYKKETETILGPTLFKTLQQRIMESRE